MLTTLWVGEDYLPEKLREQKDDITALTLGHLADVYILASTDDIWEEGGIGPGREVPDVEAYKARSPVLDDQYETIKVQNGSHHINGSRHVKSSRDIEVVESLVSKRDSQAYTEASKQSQLNVGLSVIGGCLLFRARKRWQATVGKI